MQKFKSVYFSDYPGESPKQRNLTLAFGPDDRELFGLVSNLSSESIRGVIGLKYSELKRNARKTGVSVNAFCLDQLRRAAAATKKEQLALPAMEPSPELKIDPVQATFRGGKEEPLHDWYPYLEGYSPEFVETVIDAYAPDATHILDPFAGSGTTPLTAARRGLRSSYCELNPLLQQTIETKSAVLALTPQKRAVLANSLLEIAENLKHDLEDQAPDNRLAVAYRKTFGNSCFFPEDTFGDVLRIRSWLDSLACTAPEAAAVAAVAAAASLIPTSNLIRRGDLRFRKGDAEVGLRITNIGGEVASRLRRMSVDIARLEGLRHRPLFIAGDAKRLDRCGRLEADAVVTSPPYLNGTNYYRNTKLELWFLRALQNGSDLAAFRQQTVTAGINDVSVKKRTEPVNAAVTNVVSRLAKDAYDRRIPQMVGDYFSDMDEIFRGLAKQLRPGARLLLDIGDSAYAGVHVDTPELLSELLVSRGWNVLEEVILRQRISRGGLRLRQVLLVAEAPKKMRAERVRPPKWQVRWKRFKDDLPHQSGEYAKRNWGSPLHSICSYQGKMKPSLARHLVEAFVSAGDRLLDPFGGVGTIPFEAASIGAKTWSFDISPAAVPIAAAKLLPTEEQHCIALIDALDSFVAGHRVTKEEERIASEIRFNGALSEYFHPETFKEVILARRFFLQNPPRTAEAYLVFSSLLHVLHGNRPYALSRRSHPITPFAPTGEAEYKSLSEKLLEKVNRSLAVIRPVAFKPGESLFQDATSVWPIEVDQLDAVITSPPFFDSTRFYLANWMRLWFAGWTADDFKKRPLAFVDERQKRDFRVYQPIIRQARERLKDGGVCVFHLGKSRKCDMAKEIAREAKWWFPYSEVFGESVEHCESHGIRDKGTVVEHNYLVLY